MERFGLAIRNNSGQILMETIFVTLFMAILLIVFGKILDGQRESRLHSKYVTTPEVANVQR